MSSTDCFIVSQLFNVARHIECLKLGSKPTQLYIRLSILLLSPQATYISSGITRHYAVAFVCFALLDTRVSGPVHKPKQIRLLTPLETRHPATAENDETQHDPDLPLQLKKEVNFI